MGRRGGPTQRPDRVAAILNALRAGNTRRAAAAFAEVSHETFYRWLETDVTFHDAVEKAEADAEVRFEAQIAKAATDGTWQAAAWWLERRRAQDYSRRDRVDVDVRKLVDKAADDAGLDRRAVFAELDTILGGGS